MCTHHTLIFIQHLIILAQTYKEHQSSDILETVNPFLSLTTLTTDIEKAVSQFPNPEHCLRDTGRLNTRPQDILICRQVILLRHTLYLVEVTEKRTRKLDPKKEIIILSILM